MPGLTFGRYRLLRFVRAFCCVNTKRNTRASEGAPSARRCSFHCFFVASCESPSSSRSCLTPAEGLTRSNEEERRLREAEMAWKCSKGCLRRAVARSFPSSLLRVSLYPQAAAAFGPAFSANDPLDSLMSRYLWTGLNYRCSHLRHSHRHYRPNRRPRLRQRHPAWLFRC